MTTNSDEQSAKNAHYPDQPDIGQRMDEVLYTVARKAVDESYVLDDGGSQLGKITADRIVAEGKQAITSLIKELVAEAKPINKQGEIDIDQPAYNDGYYSGADNTLEKFEQNLLKALKEVK